LESTARRTTQVTNMEQKGKYDLREFDANRKVKKQRRRTEQLIEPVEIVDTSFQQVVTTEGLEPESWLKDDQSNPGRERDYQYPELLKRIYDELHAKKGGPTGDATKILIEPPQVGKVGTRRVAWTNFAGNCKTIQRKPKHVLSFVLAELGTTGDLGSDNKLVIKGRYSPKQLENLLKKYISEYVTCKTCHSPDTQLKKENRIEFKICNTCGSSSSVASIRAGFCG